jgi:hypothetical protein
MTIFEAEMRRRIWNTVLEISLQTSMESGGPCLLSLDDFNTAPPSNFDDEQLTDPDPIPRPEEIYTQMSVAVLMRKTLPARLAVLKFLNDITSEGSYEETLRIDAELRTAYKSLRYMMQAHKANASLQPSLFALQAVDFIMQRNITALHLPFFISSLQNPVYAFSRKATFDASLKIWSLAYPKPTSDTIGSCGTDLARIARCGAGFFRMYAFHASTYLGVELRARAQEAEDDVSTMSSPLNTVIEDAIKWYVDRTSIPFTQHVTQPPSTGTFAS